MRDKERAAAQAGKVDLRPVEVGQVHLSTKEVAWMLLSDTTEAVLADSIPETATWPAYRAVGAGYWVTNGVDLRQRVSRINGAYLLPLLPSFH